MYAFDALLLKAACRGIYYRADIDRKIAEIDEDFSIQTRIDNTNIIPINYLSVTEAFPSGICVNESTSRNESVYNASELGYTLSSDTTYTNKIYIRGKSSCFFHRKACFHKRGRYVFHGCSISKGDFLGINESTYVFSQFNEVVVLPKRADYRKISELLGGLMGNISVKRFIFEDPILTIGYRDYTGREPMKSISWTQSAKQNKLMVKNYDYTTEVTVSVILNMQCIKSGLNAYTQEQTESMEQALSITRSVCEQLDEKRIAYSFTTNASISGGRRIKLSLKSGFGREHLYSVLESLGRANYGSVESVSEMLYKAKLNSSGRTVIIVTAEITDEFQNAVARLKKSCRCLVIDASSFVEDKA